MNTSFVSIRKFVIIVFGIYFGTLAIIIVGAAASAKLVRGSVGSALLYIGIAIFILGFLFMGATNRGDGATRSLHMRSDAHFKEWRKQERPFELVTWAIILAAALIAGTGYVLLYLVNSG
jgi:hypothetical protein